MFAAIVGLTTAAVSIGTKAAEVQRAKKQAKEQAAAYGEYQDQYRKQQVLAQQQAYDAAMRQQLTAAAGQGSAGGQGSAARAAMLRAPMAASQAALAAHEIAGGYAAGADQWRGNTAGIWDTYSTARNNAMGSITGALSEAGPVLAGLGQGILEATGQESSPTVGQSAPVVQYSPGSAIAPPSSGIQQSPQSGGGYSDYLPPGYPTTTLDASGLPSEKDEDFA